MAYVKPNPKKPDTSLPATEGKQRSMGITTMIQAENLFQIAVLLPVATIAGWFGGAWLDGKLHTHWIGLLGMILGGVLAMVYVIRLAFKSLAESDKNIKQ